MTCIYDRFMRGEKQFVKQILSANPNFVCCLLYALDGKVRCERLSDFVTPSEFKAFCKGCKQQLAQ